MLVRIQNVVQEAWRLFINGLQDSEPYFVTYGILTALGHIAFYIFWSKVDVQAYENFALRFIAILFGVIISLKDYWPSFLRKFLLPYWFLMVTYCLPFFFTFMLLMNHESNIWAMNTMDAAIFLVLVADWITMLFSIFIGVSCAWTLYLHLSPHPLTSFEATGLLMAYSPILLAAMFLIYRRDKVMKEIQENMGHLAASIAHELRTPLRTIQSYADGVKDYLPTLIQTYQAAQAAHLPDMTEIDPMHFKALQSAMPAISSEVQSTFTFIDMLLLSVNRNLANRDYVPCSMEKCVRQAVERFPFDVGERNLVHLDKLQDFTFQGDVELMIHVLFNLTKNALYFIRAARKGEIFISTERTENENVLYFRDTSQGISKKNLPHVFENFFSKRMHGTGVGLAFCKMVIQAFGGDIVCHSEESIYTEFTMTFPIKMEKISYEN